MDVPNSVFVVLVLVEIDLFAYTDSNAEIPINTISPNATVELEYEVIRIALVETRNTTLIKMPRIPVRDTSDLLFTDEN